MVGFRARNMAGCRTLLFGVLMVLLMEGGVYSQEDPSGPDPIMISGYCRNPSGEPVGGCTIKVLDEYFSELDEVFSDAAGYYECEGMFHYSKIYLLPYKNSSIDVWAVPDMPDKNFGYEDLVQDFVIHPAVALYFSDIYTEGIEFYQSQTLIGGMEQNAYLFYFYPDLLNLPYSGYLTLRRPFTEFRTVNGDPANQLYYDCNGKSVFVIPEYPKIHADVTGPGTYSWDSPGGIGYSYFPATPDNRLPNNPDVFVEVDFDFPNYTGDFPREHIRLNGNFALADLTPENGFTATFAYGISGCSRTDYEIEVFVKDNSNYSWWHTLEPFLSSGTSNGDLDGFNGIDLVDVGLFGTAMGSCHGEPSFDPCADYRPTGCIDISDLAEFSKIYNWNSQKSLSSDGIPVEVTFLQREGGIDVFVDSASPWRAVVVEFDLADADPPMWAPSGSFEDYSAVDFRENGNTTRGCLIALGPSGDGKVFVGSIITGNKDSGNAPHVGLIQTAALGLSSKQGGASPVVDEMKLHSASPNPFNPRTTIAFELPDRQNVSIQVFDVSGKAVRTLVANEVLGPGRHEVVWDGHDDAGGRVSSGQYLCRMETHEDSRVIRMTMLK